MIGDRFSFYKEGGLNNFNVIITRPEMTIWKREWWKIFENVIDYLEIKNTRVNISPADRFQMAWLNDQSNKIEEVIINWIWKRKYSSY